MSDLLWNLSNVTLRGDQNPRVDSLTASISAGVTSIIGYSGAGKTSLLNLLAGFETPDSGEIQFHGPSTDDSRFRIPVYWVPQDGGLWPHLTALEHIQAVQSENAGNGHRESFDSPDNLLQLFDLHGRAAAVPGEMSKGEQSRLSVARCLASRPAIMLMDEPLSHTDPVRRPKYRGLIREYQKSTGATWIFTTHEPDTTIRDAEKVICLDRGRMIYSGSTFELYHTPTDLEAAQFLGPINRFSAEELNNWVPERSSAEDGLTLRPENLELIPEEQGRLEILSFEFSGSYAETTLKHIDTDDQKTIIHRPADVSYKAGQTVRIIAKQAR